MTTDNSKSRPSRHDPQVAAFLDSLPNLYGKGSTVEELASTTAVSREELHRKLSDAKTRRMVPKQRKDEDPKEQILTCGLDTEKIQYRGEAEVGIVSAVSKQEDRSPIPYVKDDEMLCDACYLEKRYGAITKFVERRMDEITDVDEEDC